jgi:hypothetical protein
MTQQFTASEVRAYTHKVGDGIPMLSDMLRAFADRLEADEKTVPVAWRTFDGEGNYDYRDYENNEHYRDWYVSRNGAKYANWVEPLYSHPAPSDAERLADETALRHGWAYSYSGSNLYGDDGELQDNAAFPHIDWLRDSVQELHQKVAKRGAAKLATRSAPAQPPADQFDPERNVRPGDVGTELQTAEQDAADFGTGFEVDGRRVAPERVRIFRGEHAAQPPAVRVTVDAVMRVIDGQRRLPYCSIDEKQAFRNELEAALAAQENPNG